MFEVREHKIGWETLNIELSGNLSLEKPELDKKKGKNHHTFEILFIIFFSTNSSP